MEPIRDAVPGAWARLKQDVSCGLRRGAWYRVVGLTPDDAVLQVPRRERVRVPRRYLQTLFSRPRHWTRSEEHTSELQSQSNLVCRLLLEKKKNIKHLLRYHAIMQRATHRILRLQIHDVH